MNRLAAIGVLLLLVGISAGTWRDRAITPLRVEVDGFRVLSVDFHTHSSMWSDGGLTPWGLVLEARRHGLDAIAVTGHEEILDARLARWFSRLINGPTVLVGEEIISPAHHIIAAGIRETVSVRLSAAEAIDAVHRQGGIAIAAHPLREFWPGYDARATGQLDGTEVCHPLVFGRAGANELIEFWSSTRATPIGSSDFHGFGEMGACRTFLLAVDNTEGAILDAVRAHRTLAWGLDGRMFGDPRLAEAVKANPGLQESVTRGSGLDWISRITGIAGLALVVAFRRTSVPRSGFWSAILRLDYHVR